MNPQLSVVIPVFNEAGNIEPLVTRITAVLSGLGRRFELILVNDASTDATATEIARACAASPGGQEIRLPEHAGQAIALLTGIRAARGELIITLDGDGQNDPADIPPLLALVESGAVDLACGWRIDRQGGALRRLMSRAANAVRRRVLRDGVHDAGCQLRVFRRAVGAALVPMELMQSFVPALAAAAGFRVGELPVHDYPRAHGRSKYGLGRLWLRPALAMVALRWRLWRRRTTPAPTDPKSETGKP